MVTGRDSILSKIQESGIVAVIRLDDPSDVLPTCNALLEGGVNCIEITMTVPKALDQIKLVSDSLGDRMVLGVGSVIDEVSAENAVRAGARYIVSPVFKPELISKSHSMDVPIMPGCFTPSEIQSAHELGADVIKVFPAAFFGPKYIKAVKAPLPHLRLMPTGGVKVDNAAEWIQAGSFALGVGSALVDKIAISEKRFDDISKYARDLVSAVKEARNDK